MIEVVSPPHIVRDGPVPYYVKPPRVLIEVVSPHIVRDGPVPYYVKPPDVC